MINNMLCYDLHIENLSHLYLLPIILYRYQLRIIQIDRQYILTMVKANNKSKTKDLPSRQPRQYNKYHLVIRKQDKEGKKIKEIIGNFGLRKYTQGKTVGKSFYMEFNHDGLFYTPAFNEQNVTNKYSAETYMREHEKKIKKAKPKYNSQIKAAKPKGNASGYCGVCGTRYTENYSEHIKNEKHIEKRNNDKYQKMILKLEKFYNRKKMRRWEKVDGKSKSNDNSAKNEEKGVTQNPQVASKQTPKHD